MAWKIADLFVSIGADSRQLTLALSGVQHQLLGLLGVGGVLGGQISSSLLPSLLGVEAGVGMLAAGLGVGLAAAATVGIGKAVMLSSSLKESINKAEQAFGSYTDTVLKSADQMAAKYGIVKRVFIDAAAGFGLKLEGVGIGNKQAADMSVTLAKLAADAQSLFNVSFEEALTRLFSGLNGEMESVSRWGIDLTEANVKLKAMSMGLNTGSKELDQHAKALARYQLIVEGLAPATGDLERTNNEFANSLRRLQGHLENLTTEIGDNFLPTATAALNLVNAGIEKAQENTGILHMMWEGLKAPFAPLIMGWENLGYLMGASADEQAATDKAAIDARIKASQDAHAKDAAMAAAAGKKTDKPFQGSLENYAKEIQVAAAGTKTDVAKQQLAVQKQQLAILQQQLQQQKAGNGAAVALAN